MTGFTVDVTSKVAPSRLFKVGTLDSHTLVPKILPEIVSSVTLLRRQGSPGVGPAQHVPRGNFITQGLYKSPSSFLPFLPLSSTQQPATQLRSLPPHLHLHLRRGLLSVTSLRMTGFTVDVPSKVAPSRLFKVGTVDSQTVVPPMLPALVSSVTILEGDGGVGTVRLFKFTDAVPYDYVKQRTDALDREKLEYTHTTEGGVLGAKLESTTYNFKFPPAGDGGAVIKIAVEYRPKAGVELTEEDIKADKESLLGMLEVMEAYLVANPAVCA